MTVITKQVEVFEFEELDVQAQHDVIGRMVTQLSKLFTADALSEEVSCKIEAAINKCSNIRKTWSELQYIYEELKTEIHERVNMFLYDEFGGVEVAKAQAVYA